MALVDHRVSSKKGSIVREFSYPESSVRDGRTLPWNLSGAWKPGDGNFFALGGVGNGTIFNVRKDSFLVHLWDIRGPRLPVSSRDLGLGHNEYILSTQFVDDQILGMTERQLVWSLIFIIDCRHGQS